MKTIERRNEFYTVRCPLDIYGLCGTFNTEEEALAEINRSYAHALAQGFDNRHEKWVVVCNQTTRVFSEDDHFLKEETVRFVIDNAEYSEREEAYVFAY